MKGPEKHIFNSGRTTDFGSLFSKQCLVWGDVHFPSFLILLFWSSLKTAELKKKTFFFTLHPSKKSSFTIAQSSPTQMLLSLSLLYLIHTCRKWNFPWRMLIISALTTNSCAGNWAFPFSQQPKHAWDIFLDFQGMKPCFQAMGIDSFSSECWVTTGCGLSRSHERMRLLFKGFTFRLRKV